ncbi:MAG: S8 family serine peptidase [Ferruginibacter sp.]
MIKILKTLLAAIFLINTGFAQTNSKKTASLEVPHDWFQLDLKTSGYNGISLDKAYELIKTKKLKSNKVIVAVVDSGIDTLHEDLKPILWTNSKEIPGNGIDDDHNGYVDDVHGWNFLGNKDGRNVTDEGDEGVRTYYALKPKWDGKEVDESKLSAADKREYELYLETKEKVAANVDPMQTEMLKMMLSKLKIGDSIIRKELGKEQYNAKDLADYHPGNFYARGTRELLIEVTKENKGDDVSNAELIEELQGEVHKGEALSTPFVDERKAIVRDDENNIYDRFYGNGDIMAGTPFHGSHCSGIIAARRDNGVGIQGIADNVSIMMIRTVAGGDEHDKDVANAIRYAVDNGARIINISLGKGYSPQKQWVDDAILYAQKKGVLIVHAAGNDAKNIDTARNFPNPVFADGSGRATNVITVGASGDEKNGGLAASFSNYGKKEVDLFAPGVNIYSTIPGTATYGNASGTSMASPVVVGIAALILEHYPDLTPQQLKMALLKSSQMPAEKVNLPGTQDKVNLADISATGGIVNAYEAIKYAGTIKTEKKKDVLPKATIKKTKVG